MLILFHLAGIFIFQLLRNRKRLKPGENGFETTIVDELELESSITFDPPVYRQRYAKVYETIINEKWRKTIKKLVDFGCAEFGLFIFVKNTNITEFFCVDVDEELLTYYKCKLYPLTIDHLRRRNEPLNVHILCGSVAEPDNRVKNCDMVTCIELIEHLYPDSLDALPYNVFSFIHPKIAVITTPNVEFNVLFNKIDKFRHYDHKFEWTREQFEDWCTNVVTRFPEYTVEFGGMGDPCTGSEGLGFCTQMAIFTRKDLDINISEADFNQHCSCISSINNKCNIQNCYSTCLSCSPNSSFGICTYNSLSCSNVAKVSDKTDAVSNYKLLESIQYPYDVDNRSHDEKLLDTFKYRINLFGHVYSRFYVDERERCEIPIKDLMYGDVAITEDEISKLLQENGFEIGDCIIQETKTCENCVIFCPPIIDEMEEISSSSKSSTFESDNSKYQQNDECFSDWDEDYVKKEATKPIQNVAQGPAPLEIIPPPPEIICSPHEQENKQVVDPLNDSGYQKSISLLEDSPQTPLEPTLDLPLSVDEFPTSSFSNPTENSPKTSPKSRIIDYSLTSTNLSDLTERQTIKTNPKPTIFDHSLPSATNFSDLTEHQGNETLPNPAIQYDHYLPSKNLSDLAEQQKFETCSKTVTSGHHSLPLTNLTQFTERHSIKTSHEPTIFDHSLPSTNLNNLTEHQKNKTLPNSTIFDYSLCSTEQQKTNTAPKIATIDHSLPSTNRRDFIERQKIETSPKAATVDHSLPATNLSDLREHPKNSPKTTLFEQPLPSTNLSDLTVRLKSSFKRPIIDETLPSTNGSDLPEQQRYKTSPKTVDHSLPSANSSDLTEHQRNRAPKTAIFDNSLTFTNLSDVTKHQRTFPNAAIVDHYSPSTNLADPTEHGKMLHSPQKSSAYSSPKDPLQTYVNSPLKQPFFTKNPLKEQLSDSKLLKTPSEPQPQDLLEESLDLFEDISGNTPCLYSNDNRVHLKKAGKESALKSKGDRTFPPVPFAPPPPPPLPPGLLLPLEAGGKLRINVDRINELDKSTNLLNGRMFPNNQQQHFLKKSPPVRDSAPGPSNVPRKRKKLKKPQEPDDSPYDDAKSLANCILENSLNKIEIGELENKVDDKVVDLVVVPQEEQHQLEQPERQALLIEEQDRQAIVHPVVIVENGDLANNNRDVEGNNFDAQDRPLENPGDDFLNDNLGEIVPLLADNAIINNNNDGNPLEIPLQIEQHREENILEEPGHLREEPGNNVDFLEQIVDPPLEFRPKNVEVVTHDPVIISSKDASVTQQEIQSKSFDSVNLLENEEIEQTSDLARVSLEAVVDPNSERGSLDGFEAEDAVNLPLAVQEDADILPPLDEFHMLDMGNVVLLGIRQHGGETPESMDSGVPSMTTSNGFPNWLLQILGAHVIVEESRSEDGTSAQEEPHFYCQGDGLGVHPSVVGVEVDEEDDADAETENESTDSSSNHSHTDYAEIGPCPSEEQEDMTSLPEESQATVSNIEDEPFSVNSQENVLSTGSAADDPEENHDN